jgi:hypothetical protein
LGPEDYASVRIWHSNAGSNEAIFHRQVRKASGGTKVLGNLLRGNSLYGNDQIISLCFSSDRNGRKFLKKLSFPGLEANPASRNPDL